MKLAFFNPLLYLIGKLKIRSPDLFRITIQFQFKIFTTLRRLYFSYTGLLVAVFVYMVAFTHHQPSL